MKIVTVSFILIVLLVIYSCEANIDVYKKACYNSTIKPNECYQIAEYILQFGYDIKKNSSDIQQYFNKSLYCPYTKCFDILSECAIHKCYNDSNICSKCISDLYNECYSCFPLSKNPSPNDTCCSNGSCPFSSPCPLCKICCPLGQSANCGCGGSQPGCCYCK